LQFGRLIAKRDGSIPLSVVSCHPRLFRLLFRHRQRLSPSKCRRPQVMRQRLLHLRPWMFLFLAETRGARRRRLLHDRPLRHRPLCRLSQASRLRLCRRQLR
jgi:hypothetical protein